MGGSGGNACMPETAAIEIDEYEALYGDLVKGREMLLQTEMQLRAKVLAMIAAGFVGPDSDPEAFQLRLAEVDKASLRLKALMKGETPRNSLLNFGRGCH